jgi:hypothetical protein
MPSKMRMASLSLTLLLLLLGSSWALDFDDDPSLDFVWTAAGGSFDGYRVYVSRDGGEYQLEGTTLTERFSVQGHDGETIRVKVAATLGELEGPFSPESDPVIADLTAPAPPVLSPDWSYDREALTLTLPLEATDDPTLVGHEAAGEGLQEWTLFTAAPVFPLIIGAWTDETEVGVRAVDIAGRVSDPLVVPVKTNLVLRGERPAGPNDGTNRTFTLWQYPFAGAMWTYCRGAWLTRWVDFDLAGQTLTYMEGRQPGPSDVYYCWYWVLRVALKPGRVIPDWQPQHWEWR